MSPGVLTWNLTSRLFCVYNPVSINCGENQISTLCGAKVGKNLNFTNQSQREIRKFDVGGCDGVAFITNDDTSHFFHIQGWSHYLCENITQCPSLTSCLCATRETCGALTFGMFTKETVYVCGLNAFETTKTRYWSGRNGTQFWHTQDQHHLECQLETMSLVES